MTHICVSKLTIIGSTNGLLPGRCQAIIWTNAGILLIGPLGTNFSEILSKIHSFSFKKMHLKMSSAKWPPFCFGLNVLSACSKYIWDPNLVITLTADDLAHNRARPSIGTELTEKGFLSSFTDFQLLFQSDSLFLFVYFLKHWNYFPSIQFGKH